MNEPLLAAFLSGLVALLASVVCLWIVSLRTRDVTLVDVFWGPGFALVAWIYSRWAPALPPRSLLVLALVTLWATRLAVHIHLRGRGRPEDSRYTEMRLRHGHHFGRVSLGTVFLLQGTLIAVISTPLLVTLVRPGPAAWVWTDALGLGLWVLGFTFEAVGDWQLTRFRAVPANRGRVLRHGLWRYTRHPNYFGDAALWWGTWAFALGSPGGVWTLPSVLLMTFLLLRVSGVALLERTIVERRPDYRDYVAATSAFLPWWPRRS